MLTFSKHWLKLCKIIFKEYFENQYTYYAAALTFSSLLALIPIITICIAILAVLPFYQTVIQQVENFIFSHFILSSGNIVQSHLHQIVNNALHLSGISLLFLIIVCLQMVNTIEQTFDTIWGIKKHRTWLSAIIFYTAILVVGPLLIGTGFIIHSLLAASAFFNGTQVLLIINKQFLSLIPMLLDIIAFTLMYIIVPNRKVPFNSGFMAGLTAAVLFEIAKNGFGYYISHFSNYETIYGSLAVIPIFLIWVYISWCIILLGALMSKVLTFQTRT